MENNQIKSFRGKIKLSYDKRYVVQVTKCLANARRFRFNEERKFTLPKALGITFKENSLSG